MTEAFEIVIDPAKIDQYDIFPLYDAIEDIDHDTSLYRFMRELVSNLMLGVPVVIQSCVAAPKDKS